MDAKDIYPQGQYFMYFLVKKKVSDIIIYMIH